jgi:hypothetical protein
VFGSKEVSYLGFCLTEEGIKPGTDKLKAVKNAPPPSNVHEVRQFLGLCNFFRGHVRNFAQLTSPLTTLTKKGCSWKGGQLPPDTLKAFQELQTYLCSEPIVETGPMPLLSMPASATTKSPGALGPFLRKSIKKVSIVLSLTPAENYKNTNATTPLFCSKCKLPFGAWTILPLISEEENLRSSQTTDL